MDFPNMIKGFWGSVNQCCCFLILTSILLCEYNIIHLSTHFMGRESDPFQFGAITSKTALNICI